MQIFDGGVKNKRKLLQSAAQTRRPYVPAAIPLNPYNEQVPLHNTAINGQIHNGRPGIHQTANPKAITLRNSNIPNNTMSLRDILSPTFGTSNPNAQVPQSGSSGRRPQSSGNFFRVNNPSNVNARRQTINGRRIEQNGNDTMGSMIEGQPLLNDSPTKHLFTTTNSKPSTTVGLQDAVIRKNYTAMNDSFAHLESFGIKTGARDLNKLESVDRLIQNASQANHPIVGSTSTSSTAMAYNTTKTQRCNTAAGLGGANPRSNGRVLHGSKQVINHIQTIIRNTNATKTSNIDNNDSFDDFNGSTGAIQNMKQTNNFFTTDVKETKGSVGNITIQQLVPPPRLHTATGTNRVKNSFYNGFQPVNQQTSQTGETLAATAANIQRVHATAIEKQENSFTRKLKENKEAFRKAQQFRNTAYPRAGSSVPGNFTGQMIPSGYGISNGSQIGLKEFSTAGCSDISDYQLGKQIGNGAYAVVREAVHKPTNEKVAIKVYDRFKLMDIQRKKSALREIKILSKLNHPQIVRLYESIDCPTTTKSVYLVMEYVQGESLHAHLKAQQTQPYYRRFPEETCRAIIKQLLNILNYLHLKNVTHRDIKLENILVDRKTGKLKLIDFGFCCCTAPDTKLKIFCGTPSYMSPEIVQKRDYLGPPTDIWATGILLYALLCGHFPFKGQSDKELYKKISKGQFTSPDHMSKEAKNFLSKMLVVEPEKRVTAQQLLEEPWLKSSKPKEQPKSDTALGSIAGAFLSTNESSGQNPQKQPSEGWKQYEQRLIQIRQTTATAADKLTNYNNIQKVQPTQQQQLIMNNTQNTTVSSK